MKVHYTKSEHQGSSYVGTVSPDQQQLSRQRLLITFHLRTFNYRCGRLNLGPPAQTLSMALLHLYWEREWEEGTGGGGGGRGCGPEGLCLNLLSFRENVLRIVNYTTIALLEISSLTFNPF